MGFRDRWEPYIVSVINMEVGGFLPTILRVVFHLLSYLYTFIVEMRIFLYRHGILRSKALGCLVISVGNITVGGTGKTPVVEMIARHLINAGRKVAILSRGYKSRYPSNDTRYPKVVSEGKGLLLNVDIAGDEPYMLAKELPQAVVLVDKNRVRAAKFAIKKFGVDTVILDDGYQYLRLSRQVNIVLIDCTNPFGRHRLLPGGILREPVRNLNRANIFFLTKTKGMDLYVLKKRLKMINPKAEIIETAHMPRFLNDVYSGTKRDLGWLVGRRVSCVSGIADPKGFERVIGELGAVIINSHRFPDHHVYSEEEINEIVRCAKLQKVEALITTQKDAVRFPRITPSNGIPFYYLRVEIEILTGAKDFYDRICRMCY